MKQAEHSVAGWGNTQAREKQTTAVHGRTHIGRKYYKITDEEVKVLARHSSTWLIKISGRQWNVTHKPKMNRDNGYDLPAIYKNILQQHPQDIRGAQRPEGLTSPPLKKASTVMAESSGRATISSFRYGKFSCYCKFINVCEGFIWRISRPSLNHKNKYQKYNSSVPR